MILESNLLGIVFLAAISYFSIISAYYASSNARTENTQRAQLEFPDRFLSPELISENDFNKINGSEICCTPVSCGAQLPQRPYNLRNIDDFKKASIRTPALYNQ